MSSRYPAGTARLLHRLVAIYGNRLPMLRAAERTNPPSEELA
jgi:hypothetical protein